MKRASLQLYSTTTTCREKMCKCHFSLSNTRVLVTETFLFLYQTGDAGSTFVVKICAAFTVLLVAADPHLQRLHVTVNAALC